MSGTVVLPVCYCTAHDGAHVHLPPPAARPGWLSERLARSVLNGAADTDAARTFARLILGLEPK